MKNRLFLIFLTILTVAAALPNNLEKRISCEIGGNAGCSNYFIYLFIISFIFLMLIYLHLNNY